MATAPRVDNEEVQVIVGTARDTSAFIDTAHLLVEEIVVPGSGYSKERLARIELYLAAHYWTLSNPSLKQFGSGRDDNVTYQDQAVGTGLKATVFGQQALGFDTARLLEGALDRRTAVFEVH